MSIASYIPKESDSCLLVRGWDGSSAKIEKICILQRKTIRSVYAVTVQFTTVSRKIHEMSKQPLTVFLGKLFTLGVICGKLSQLSYSYLKSQEWSLTRVVVSLVCVRIICVSTHNIDIAQSILAISIV